MTENKKQLTEFPALFVSYYAKHKDGQTGFGNAVLGGGVQQAMVTGVDDVRFIGKLVAKEILKDESADVTLISFRRMESMPPAKSDAVEKGGESDGD